jgi:lipoate-protein ligase A
VKSVRSRVTNLIEHKPNLKYDDIVDAFYQQFCDAAGHKVDMVTLDEIRKDNPEAEKYYQRHISDEWKLGRNPEFNHSFDEKFDWGSVQFNFMVKDNRVKEVRVYTDSLLPDYFQKIDEVLLGEDYHSKSLIHAITHKINLDELTLVDSKPDHEMIKNIEQINKDLFILLDKSI